MILRPAPVSSARFTYDPPENLLVAEASDLPPFERVYDDAADEGLTVVSVHTGREVVYGVTRVERDREGDLVFWDLRPAAHGTDALPTVRIFND